MQSNSGNLVFTNNPFFKRSNWPEAANIQPVNSIFGDAKFYAPGSFDFVGYIPQEKALVQNKGIDIHLLPGDSIGLKIGLLPGKDILGINIVGKPDIGAIEVHN